MKMFLMSLLSLFAVNAFAESYELDSRRLYSCGGEVELRQAPSGDLALKFKGVNQRYCTKLKFVDVTSRRTIGKVYEFDGTSYTLSKKMENSLGSDCSVEFQLLNYNGSIAEKGRVKLSWWACYVSPKPQPTYPSPILVPSKKNSPFSYELSKQNNCKIMLNGQYTNKITDNASVCSPLYGYPKGSYLQYQWSKQDHCKIMINGQYIRNTSDFYCSVRH